MAIRPGHPCERLLLLLPPHTHITGYTCVFVCLLPTYITTPLPFFSDCSVLFPFLSYFLFICFFYYNFSFFSVFSFFPYHFFFLFISFLFFSSFISSLFIFSSKSFQSSFICLLFNTFLTSYLFEIPLL